MKRTIQILAVLMALQSSSALAAGDAHHAEGVPTKAVIFATINFILLFLILGYFLRKPVREFFASRSALIKQSLKESEEIKEAADKKFSEYESRLQGIEAEMKALIEELKEDGELERVRIIEEAKDQAASLKEISERVMTQELQKAKESLKREAVTLAAELAEQLVKESMTPEDQKRIVDQYLDKMERLS